MPWALVEATAGVDMPDELVEDAALRQLGDGRVGEQQVQLVVAEERQVVEVAAPDEDLVVDAQDLGVGHLRVEQDLRPGIDEPAVPVPERGGRVGRRGLSRGDQPHPDPAQRGRKDPLEDGPVRDVRVDDVDLLGGIFEGASRWRR